MSPRTANLVTNAAAVAAIALFVVAGNWQRGRMNAKEADRAAVVAAATLAPVPLPDPNDWTAWRWRRVVATGTWRGAAQLLIDNRIVDGHAGFSVITPLALDDGRAVLVDRGWTPAGAGESRVPRVDAPSGRATVAGRVVVPPARYLEFGATAAPSSNVWQNLDPARIATATGLKLVPIVIEQDPAAPADGLMRRWASSGPDATTHRIYMWQWYLFAALVAVLWIGFTVKRLWERA
ncbi:MAG: SURF1 family protein [Vicinamibacteria bacterium]